MTIRTADRMRAILHFKKLFPKDFDDRRVQQVGSADRQGRYLFIYTGNTGGSNERK